MSEICVRGDAPYLECMPSNHSQLQALRDLVAEVELILETTRCCLRIVLPLPAKCIKSRYDDELFQQGAMPAAALDQGRKHYSNMSRIGARRAHGQRRGTCGVVEGRESTVNSTFQRRRSGHHAQPGHISSAHHFDPT